METGVGGACLVPFHTVFDAVMKTSATSFQPYEPTLALNFWYPLSEQDADLLGKQTRYVPTVLFIILTGNLGHS